MPRTRPRLEQHLRAERAEQQGLVRLLDERPGRQPERMAAMLRELPSLPTPALERYPGFMDGLEHIADFVEPWLSDQTIPLRPKRGRRRPLHAAGGWLGH